MSLMDNSCYPIMRNWIRPPDFHHNIFMSFCVNTSNLIYLIFTDENVDEATCGFISWFHTVYTLEYFQSKNWNIETKAFSLIIILLKCM